mgnify:CR=1 FL=1
MKVKRSFYIILTLMCTIFTVMSFSVTANADMGPKPSVHILFENMGDELCYGTLLSSSKSSGPACVWDGVDENAQHNENEEFYYADFDYETWKAFVEYEDADGYYFLQEGWTVSETKEIAWTYYPPYSFKILLYYPETKTFAVSGIYERYAFDTYYTVDMDGVNIGSVEYNDSMSTDERINAYRSYLYGQEFLSLAARIVITIVLEMVIALFFGFRKKKQLLVLALVNVITQVILNVLLNFVNYEFGPFMFVLFYIIFEIIVFAIEAVLYCTILKRVSENPKKNWYYTLYALVANAVSFGAGFIISQLLPGIF